MNRSPRVYMTGLVLSMLVGMIIAACFGAGPAPTEADPEAAPAESEAAAPAESEPAAPEAQSESTLSIVQDRGYLICIVSQNGPAFASLNEDGDYEGLDADYCRAVAAAIFGDPEAVEFRPTTSKERFTVLSSGEADVLFRTTTWTMSRDTDLGANFGPTTFYDGQGMMVRIEDGFETLEDLNGASICVATGTTTELNLADVFSAGGIEYEPVVFEEADQVYAAYEEGRCDAVTSDKSALNGRKAVLQEPSAHTIMDVTMSKEPLGPMMRHGDDQWFDLVNWVVYATFLAEEHGITSENIDSFVDSGDPNIAKFMGEEGDFGQKIGLSNDWAVNIIKGVGNYAEMYDRHLGPDTNFYIPRGLNSLYTDGGLLYAPPIR